MKITFDNNRTCIKDCNSFCVKETLECGQVFRYESLPNNRFSVIAFGALLIIEQPSANEVLLYCNEQEFNNVWRRYFDLDTDYQQIKAVLSDNDITLRDACEYAGGIRILKQDLFECIISFIISQNNRIPRIKQLIQNISQRYGKAQRYADVTYYSFPTPEELKDATIADLAELKTGFRAKYIADCVSRINSGALNLSELIKMDTSAAKEQLMAVSGIGDKVSDCILLYSLSRTEVFPTDVWVKRVMEHFYFNGNETKITQIHQLADKKFKHLAGYAQQYLFHFARQFKIGV